MTTPVDRVVRFFTESKSPVLFTGAGVSAKAGVPIWGKLLSNLAEWLRSRDALIANKMVNLIAKQDYLRAAEFFYLSDEVTDRERTIELLKNLTPSDPGAIDILCTLPVLGAVTTNFDRTLFDGFASARKSAVDFRRGDNSFRQALFTKELHVCRIHGFIEDPESIVLTSRHFDELEKDTIYRDILVKYFTEKNLLLLGFSFSDPAILSVLQSVNKAYGPLAIGAHLALVPEDVSADVIGRLNRLNIEVLRYDHNPDDYKHSALWETISQASERLKDVNSAPSEAQSESTSPFANAKKYLASCYARANLGAQIGPLREAIVEGMISAILMANAPRSTPYNELLERIHLDTKINRDDAEQLVSKCLATLSDENLCIWHRRANERKVTWIGATNDNSELETAIATLVQNTVDRAFVEEGYRSVSEVRKCLKAFYTNLVLQRGWDLGAAFASGRIPSGSDLKSLMYHSAKTIGTRDIEILLRVCERMIQNPTVAEATILAALGRASFGLELALQAPRSHILQAATLPSRIYLDANVVMPAFIEGHTYNPIYSETIKSLSQAVDEHGGTQICTLYGYLNEVVSHRRLALEQYQGASENFREDVIKEAMFSGATNMNVFVGAYANMAASDPKLRFDQYLQKYAPFVTEMDLAKWLSFRGVHVIKSVGQDGKSRFAEVSLELQKAFSSSLKTDKDVRLLEHDALQLAALSADLDNGNRAIMVTADRRLRDAVANSKMKNLAGHMMSHVGLTQLVDLIIGSRSDRRSLAHLLWDAKISERSNELRRYFIGLALQHYDEAMAMELPGLVDKFTEDVVQEAKRQGMSHEGREGNEQRKWLKIAGSYDDRFFAAIGERMELRRQQSGGS